MGLPKCPQCGGPSGHWNELCEGCADKYWKMFTPEQTEDEEEAVEKVANIKVGDQVITKDGFEGKVLWVGKVSARLEAPNSTRWSEKLKNLVQTETEMGLDTFINLYRQDHPDYTVHQAIEYLNKLRADGKAQVTNFDNEESGFPIWDSGLSLETRGIVSIESTGFREYLVVKGCTGPSGNGWPVEVRIPLKDWYLVKIRIF